MMTSKIDEEIQRVLLIMKDLEPSSEEYSRAVANLETLLEHKPKWFDVSGDAILTSAASLLGVVLILNYERLNVITSKAMSLVPKIKM